MPGGDTYYPVCTPAWEFNRLFLRDNFLFLWNAFCITEQLWGQTSLAISQRINFWGCYYTPSLFSYISMHSSHWYIQPCQNIPITYPPHTSDTSDVFVQFLTYFSDLYLLHHLVLHTKHWQYHEVFFWTSSYERHALPSAGREQLVG